MVSCKMRHIGSSRSGIVLRCILEGTEEYDMKEIMIAASITENNT
jgi:hypothetical protein